MVGGKKSWSNIKSWVRKRLYWGMDGYNLRINNLNRRALLILAGEQKESDRMRGDLEHIVRLAMEKGKLQRKPAGDQGSGIGEEKNPRNGKSISGSEPYVSPVKDKLWWGSGFGGRGFWGSRTTPGKSEQKNRQTRTFPVERRGRAEV